MKPPAARLELTLTVSANSVEELADKLADLSEEVAMREEGQWDVASSRGWSYRTAFDPDVTAAQYEADLLAWLTERRLARG